MLPPVIKSGQLCTVEGKNILSGVNSIISSIIATQMEGSGSCLISLDFFKAYDRVYLPFLENVMTKMNFSFDFVAWILMLHDQASTRLIVSGLTDPI